MLIIVLQLWHQTVRNMWFFSVGSTSVAEKMSFPNIPKISNWHPSMTCVGDFRSEASEGYQVLSQQGLF